MVVVVVRGGGAWALPNAPPTGENGEKGRDRCTVAWNVSRIAVVVPYRVIPIRSLGSCRGILLPTYTG
jgi:hypothetical protein